MIPVHGTPLRLMGVALVRQVCPSPVEDRPVRIISPAKGYRSIIVPGYQPNAGATAKESYERFPERSGKNN